MTLANRVPAGTPAGGRFAPGRRAEADVALAAAGDPDFGARPPAWGEELETAIADNLEAWVLDEYDGDGEETRDLADLVPGGDDEDDLIAAYGERRSDWLIEAKVALSGATRQTYGAGLDGPAEHATAGTATIRHNGRLLRSATFTHEDPPRFGRVLALAPQPACPECGRDSDQDHGVPCSMCMSQRCSRCLSQPADGEDGLCEACATAIGGNG